MPRVCKQCGLEFDNKKLHDTHWKKCVKNVTFIAYNGQEITTTRHQNGTFLCYCSHSKCPKDQGFTTIDAMQKHMKNLKTTWLGREKKVHSSSQSSNLIAHNHPIIRTSNLPMNQKWPKNLYRKHPPPPPTLLR